MNPRFQLDIPECSFFGVVELSRITGKPKKVFVCKDQNELLGHFTVPFGNRIVPKYKQIEVFCKEDVSPKKLVWGKLRKENIFFLDNEKDITRNQLSKNLSFHKELPFEMIDIGY